MNWAAIQVTKLMQFVFVWMNMRVLTNCCMPCGKVKHCCWS